MCDLGGGFGFIFWLTCDAQQSGEIVFSHRLRPGLNRNSHGLSIARLAGVPDEVLQTARSTLKALGEDADE